jgi:ketosteroid isomerase-like protein
VAGGRDPESVVRELWRCIDRHGFAEAAELLMEDARVVWPASDEVLTRDQWLRANAEYGGDWAASVERVVAAGGAVACATRVFARTNPDNAFYAVSFATIEGGRIRSLVEYWSDVAPDTPLTQARIRGGLSSRP